MENTSPWLLPEKDMHNRLFPENLYLHNIFFSRRYCTPKLLFHSKYFLLKQLLTKKIWKKQLIWFWTVLVSIYLLKRGPKKTNFNSFLTLKWSEQEVNCLIEFLYEKHPKIRNSEWELRRLFLTNNFIYPYIGQESSDSSWTLFISYQEDLILAAFSQLVLP